MSDHHDRTPPVASSQQGRTVTANEARESMESILRAVPFNPYHPEETAWVIDTGREVVAHIDQAEARIRELEEEQSVLRQTLNDLCTDDGYFGDLDRFDLDLLVGRGLLVEVPADEYHRGWWDSDTMYVWAWHPLALNRETTDE